MNHLGGSDAPSKASNEPQVASLLITLVSILGLLCYTPWNLTPVVSCCKVERIKMIRLNHAR